MSSAVSFLQAGIRNSLGSNALTGADRRRKVLPECTTPSSEISDTMTTPDEKIAAVLSDPKFGMFSLFKFHCKHGRHNDVLKKKNTLYCSHVCSLLMALPILVFFCQWLMFISLVDHQVKTYTNGFCPQTASPQSKIMMSAIALMYFVRSFFLWDSLVDRTRRKRMIPSTSIIVMMDTFQEFGFNIMVYITNLLLIYLEPDCFNMVFNSMAMEFLMQMDNEFEREYFEFLPGVAEQIYDEKFVTYQENLILVANKTRDSKCFRCFKTVTWIPYKLLLLCFVLCPPFCFVMIFFGGICK